MEQSSASKSRPPESKVKVIVRVRPLIKEELDSRLEAKTIAVKAHSDRRRITISKSGLHDREFTFDHIAANDYTTQESFYEAAGDPLVTDLFTGYNSTIIAYGQVKYR